MPDEVVVSTKIKRNSIRPIDASLPCSSKEANDVHSQSNRPRAVLRQQPSQSECGRFGTAWRDYCQTARVAGLPYVGGRKKHGVCSRLLWIALFIFLLVMCSKLYYKTYRKLYSYSLQTDISYHQFMEQEFPSITFCSKNPFRSEVFCNDVMLLAALHYFANPSPREFVYLFEMARRFNKCQQNQSEVEQSMENIEKMSIDDKVKLFATDYHQLVGKCWWDNKEMNCSGQFVTHMLFDNKVCFTFNPSYELGDQRNSLQYHDWFTKSGPRTGLRLLLNTREKGSGELNFAYPHGSGFDVYIHDKNSYLFLDEAKLLKINPGFHHSISLISNIFSMHTEHLGMCSSRNQETCLLNCFNEQLLLRCNCFYTADQEKARTLHIPISSIIICSSDQQHYMCFSDLLHYFQQYSSYFCPCRGPCFRRVYEYQLSATVLMDPTMRVFFGNSTGSDIGRITKEHLMVDFYYQSNRAMVVTVRQALTMYGLIMNNAHLTKLALGISFVFCVEFVFYIFVACYRAMKRPMKQQKNIMVVEPICESHLMTDFPSTNDTKKPLMEQSVNGMSTSQKELPTLVSVNKVLTEMDGASENKEGIVANDTSQKNEMPESFGMKQSLQADLVTYV